MTAKARTNIRHFLKQQRREDSIDLGLKLLEKSLSALDTHYNALQESQINAYLEQAGYKHVNQLLEDIAKGNRVATIVAQQLLGEKPGDGGKDAFRPQPVAIRRLHQLGAGHRGSPRALP